MISYQELVAAGRALLGYAAQTVIPYVGNGMALSGMDCQGLCEYLLIQCGLARSEVNLAGSNAHWRKSLKWRGTIEEAVALFGDIPKGAWLFIHSPGANAKYKDNDGDASHMGQYLDNLQAVHASASRKQVAESAVKRKSINGGWNMVGLNRWTAFAPEVEAKLAGGESGAASGDMELEAALPAYESNAPASVREYVRVQAPDGGAVKIREKHDVSIYKYKAPNGTVMLKTGSKGNYLKVLYEGKERLVDSRFVVPHEMG